MCPSDRYQAAPDDADDSHRHSGTATGFRPAFDALDADHDGKIGPDDLKALAVVPEGDIGAMIAAADADRNGYVDFHEFEKVLGARSGGGRRGIMEEVFGAMDRDGDGKVGFEDLRQYLVEVVGMKVDDEEVRAMIAMAGGDGIAEVGFDGLVRILAVDSHASWM